MANNLKDYGSFIPGYRPGKRTADYLEKVMMRITYVGAAFLAVVAIIPTLISTALDVDYARRQLLRRHRPADRHQRGLDLVQKIDSHLVMRNYTGLLENESVIACFSQGGSMPLPLCRSGRTTPECSSSSSDRPVPARGPNPSC